MAELSVPQIDFGTLGQLPQVYRAAQAEDLRKQTLAGLGQGGTVDAQALLKSGDLSLAQLGIGLQNSQSDRERQARQDAFQREESARAQRNADRSFGLQAQAAARAGEGLEVKATQRARIAIANGLTPDMPEFKAFVLNGEYAPSTRAAPAGFQMAPDGRSLVPLPGGPADPDYIKKTTDAKDKGKSMSINDITKLSEEGGKFSNLNTFSDTFKPEYAGRTILGDAANAAGRNLPETVVGKSVADGASWWQGYDRYKNVVRNELFGSALTAPEKAAFESADITPRMNPAQVKKNLATQKAITENGLKRKANAMIEAGYKPEAIASAYGVSLDSIGVSPSRVASAPSQGNGADAILQQARDAISKGAPREAVMKRLQEAGVDGSGL